MNLRVLGASVEDPDLVKVEGLGVLGWCAWGEGWEPGTTVDVELDVPAAIPWDEITVGHGRAASAVARARTLELRGTVLDIDRAGTVTLSLPQGAILLVDTTGHAPVGIVGQDVTLRVEGVVAYPTHV